MKTVKFIWFTFLLLLGFLLSGCQTVPPKGSGSAAPVPAELTQPQYLFEIVRYLYRWQLDEAEVERLITAKEFVFWIRRVEARLDPGDHSILGEILMPGVNLRVKVKKTDYRIEELGTEVTSKSFMITQVNRERMPTRAPSACIEFKANVKEMRDYLFRTRNQHDYPEAVLVERLRQALRQEAAKQGLLPAENTIQDRIVHLAPISPVANEIWVFWESGRKLFHFASDIDLANPAVWQHQTLLARIFDLDEQVIVSHQEAPGSNRFLTRYQVSRALFNCVLYGQRMEVPPPNLESEIPPAGSTPLK